MNGDGQWIILLKLSHGLNLKAYIKCCKDFVQEITHETNCFNTSSFLCSS